MTTNGESDESHLSTQHPSHSISSMPSVDAAGIGEKGKTAKKPTKMIGDYVLGKILGTGSYGHVRLGVHQHTGQQVAIKTLKVKDSKTIRTVEREVSILKLLRHPNIVRLYDVVVVEDKVGVDGKVVEKELPKHNSGLGLNLGSGTAYLILELASGGELFDYVVARGRLREREARKFFRQIISGLEYCHTNLVVHRDLKPENLLLDKDGNIKINDFGFSNIMRPGDPFSTYCGSLSYVAPEIIRNIPYNGPEIDIWSIGVILYTLVCGRLPWAETAEGGPSIQGILRGDYDRVGLRHVSDTCKHLISRILLPDPTLRATLQEVRTHPWVNEGYDDFPPCLVSTYPPVTNINEEVLIRLVAIGFDEYEALTALKQNTRCPAVATYHLLLAKWDAEHNPPSSVLDSLSASVPSPSLLSSSADYSIDSDDLSSSVGSGGSQRGGSFLNTPPSNRHALASSENEAIVTRRRMDSAPPRPDFTKLRLETPAQRVAASPSDFSPSATHTPPQSPRNEPASPANRHTPPPPGGGRLLSNRNAKRSSRRMSAQLSTNSYGSPFMSQAEAIHQVLSSSSTPTSPIAQASVVDNFPSSPVELTPPAGRQRTHTIATGAPAPFAHLGHVGKNNQNYNISPMPHNPIVVSPPSSRTSVSQLGQSSPPPTPPVSRASKIASSVPGFFKSLLKSDPKKPKEVKLKEGVFSVDTTTTLHPLLIVEEVKNCLAPSPASTLHIDYKVKGYLFECEDRDSTVRFEIEICRIKGTEGWNGVRLKRMKGDLWIYKDLCQKLLSRMKL